MKYDGQMAQAGYRGSVAVRDLGAQGIGACFVEVDIETAEALRNQLTAAIEKAKRQEDGFEGWFDSLQIPQEKYRWAQACRIILGEWVSRKVARAIWDAATKAAGEGK